MKKLTTSEKIRRELIANPNASLATVAKKMDVRYQTVWGIKKAMAQKAIADTKKDGLRRNAQGKILMQRANAPLLAPKLETPTPKQEPVVGEGDAYEHKNGQWQAVDIDVATPKADNVNHPPHYKQGGIETIDFIEAKQLNYHLGNVIKYVTRADHKGNKVEDLKKARWYLNREISKLDGAEV